MKENATHIRLIRDKDGKPVEAEYILNLISITDFSKRDFGYTIIHQFNNWAKAKANRIPVTGDWPTDKHVFAKDEVEPVECVEPTSKLYMWRNYTALRLKATLSDTNTLPPGDYESPLTDAEKAEGNARRRAIQAENLRQSEVTVKEGERIICQTCGDYFGVNVNHQCFKCLNPLPLFSQSKRGDWKAAKEKRFQQGEELFEPKQEAKTAEEVSIERYPFVDTLPREMHYHENDVAERQQDAFVAGAEWAKQQYQQEIIEKLEIRMTALNNSTQMDWRDRKIRIRELQIIKSRIQSTK